MASMALAPAFDRWRPAPLSRLPTMRLQAATASNRRCRSERRDPFDPPGVLLLPDPVHPRLPLAFVRHRGLHGGGRIFEGVVTAK